ncbi:MAG TPA: carboxypeptidase-like regulatory domain-containing protein, partial [Vicinamibacteria bacterium]|nr:carboxypeptidase-like regulatory domain-containing protein [Vicinamibacteria bacterium]
MNVIATLLFAASMAAATPARFEGTVRDATGAPVANAAVSVEGGGDAARTSTDAEGRFSVEWGGPKLVTVTVEASGFARTQRAASVGDAPVDLVLS